MAAFGHFVSDETKRKIGLGNSKALKGRKISKNVRDKISKALQGHRAWNKGKKTPESVKEKISKSLIGRAIRGSGWHHSEEYRIRKSLMHRGNKSHFWKGGLTAKSKIIRNSSEFKLWREAIFSRDDWTCQNCRKRNGSELHPHHIKSFSEYPQFRFVVNNGITLCLDCHKALHRPLAEMRKP